MSDEAMELTGRIVPRPARRPTRTLDIPSRVVKRREAILSILDAAYLRDVRGTARGLDLS